MMRPPPAAFIAGERSIALARSRRAVATERARTYRHTAINEALLDLQAFSVIVAAIVMVCGSTLALIDWLAS
ncbi:hypothetical protein FSZ31_04230 [Sphingorhabdus soli]|uniref:Uncharacterized protein n=1 Tax=Flavisphingopyxis soli TaxID=2601267 RepID=A0A5C6UT58_9SPHN|nr:hypothetical protein [Sphingorhabdus soli]TXC73935.1 hypothetical protein FSZ31_04230 [Sphingorhabdus soli]